MVENAQAEFGVDCIIASGGLSVIGLAKAVNVSLQQPVHLVGIPTTYSGNSFVLQPNFPRLRDD